MDARTGVWGIGGNEYNLYNTVYKKIKDKDATFNYLKKANGNSLEIGWQLGLLKDDIKTYLADVVKANDEYLKTEKLIFEFGDFNSRQEEVFDRIRPVIEEFFSRSKFIKEVIILLDYKHPFWDRTFFHLVEQKDLLTGQNQKNLTFKPYLLML